MWWIGFGGWGVVMDSDELVLGSDVLTGFGSGGQRNLVKSDNIFSHLNSRKYFLNLRNYFLKLRNLSQLDVTFIEHIKFKILY